MVLHLAIDSPAQWAACRAPAPFPSGGGRGASSRPCPPSTFTHNMLAFGLNKKLCNDFLKKQAVIGNLDEGEWRQGRGFRAECAACWNPHPAQRTVPAVITNRTLNVPVRLRARDTLPSPWRPGSAR